MTQLSLGLVRAYIFLLIALFSSGVFSAANDIGQKRDLFKIDKIVIKGTKKVEEEAIFEKIDSRVGLILDNYILKRDIEKIHSLRFFETVEARHLVVKGKNHLIFYVKEKPIINEIVLEGNEGLDSDDLYEQIKVKEYSILDVNSIKKDVEALQKYYEEKGYYLAGVNYRLEKLDKENVTLVYEIKEFTKVKVKKITFLGNRAIPDEKLKSLMETREENVFSWMSGSGNFKEFNFQTDIERLKYFYKSKGHLQVFIGTPEITVSEDKKWVFITISVNEGPVFTVNEISFDGEVLFPEEELLEKIQLKSGENYSEDLLRKDIQFLTEKYQDLGYAFANVLRTLNPVPGENKVDVNFSFEKGKIAYFGKISVKGNNKTRDKVVRRELRIREGMKYSGSALRRSKENVNRLGFFEPNSVVFNTVSPKGKDDVLDVEINVKERNTGQISLGAGYSTSSKGFIRASVRQNNFRGLGQILDFTLDASEQRQTYKVSFTEPYLFDTKWTAGGDLYSTKDDRSAVFKSEKKGFAARVGYPVFDYARLFMTYKLEDTKLTNDVENGIDETLENGVASIIDTTLIHDKRNNKFEPSAGHYQALTFEYAGIGGAKKWFKTDLEARWYKAIYGELVFRSRFNGAQLVQTDNGREIPQSEKFYLGGSRDLRGYGFEDIGPRGTYEVTLADGSKEERIFNQRGLFSVLTQLELEHPLIKEAGLKWVVFFDAGNVYSLNMGHKDDWSLRYDYGFGFRWFSPIGVLRFEFGYPIAKKDTEASSQFHFDIGQIF